MPRDTSWQRHPAGLAAGAKRVLTLQQQQHGVSSDAHIHTPAKISKAHLFLQTLLFVETAIHLIYHLMGVTFKPLKLIFH